MSPSEATEILYDWDVWARDAQKPAPFFDSIELLLWMVMAGRGFGKTTTGAQCIQEGYRRGYGKMGFVGRSSGDVRDIMIEGPAGILAIAHPSDRPKWTPTKRLLTWPNGASALTYSGENPEQLRGPQHDLVWADELAAWKYPQLTYDNIMLGLRLGLHPKAIVTTTPKPLRTVREILDRDDVLLTRGSTYENIENLAPPFIKLVLGKYEGTTTGQQEIYGELLEEAEGALWSRKLITDNRVDSHPVFVRVAVAIDIATTSKESSDETGIIAGGIDDRTPPHAYIIGDASGRYSPSGWANRGIELMRSVGGDRLIGETNQGGDMIESTLRVVDPNVPYKGVHASRGKRARAEPIVALYEQGRVHHVGSFQDLEDQLCTWEPESGDDSPDRLDANVWLLTELLLGNEWSII